MAKNTFIRSMHDVGLAAWFGGSLMGAVGLNAAAGAVTDQTERSRVANEGWDRWTPLNAAAIGAHLLGGAGLIVVNRDRLAQQKGVAGMTAIKTAFTGVALAASAYSRVLGRKLSDAQDFPASSGTEPSAATPPDLAKAQSQLRMLQWVIPASTAAILVANSYAGEQQRPSEVHKGVVERARQLVA
jgi:hypothetical protein